MGAKKVVFYTTVLAMFCSPHHAIPYTHEDKIARTTKDVYSRIYYEEDIGEDDWSTPEATRELGWGDCEDRAIVLIDELNKKGIHAEFAAGKRKKDGRWRGHAWAEWRGVDGIEYVLDSGKMFHKSDWLENKGYSQYTKKQLQPYLDEFNDAAGRKIL